MTDGTRMWTRTRDWNQW